jgi:hypothetical protein
MIDRDTVIDFVAAVDTEFMKREVGTYNGFDLYERFAMYVEAKVRKEEREAYNQLCAVNDQLLEQRTALVEALQQVIDLPEDSLIHFKVARRALAKLKEAIS